MGHARLTLKKGERYGRLTVMAPIEPHSGDTKYWFKCDCKDKTIFPAAAHLVKNGYIQSCGCLHMEILVAQGARNVTHGQARTGKVTTEYFSWSSMMARCYRKSLARYKYYGGRGITVCERWHTFANFFADMGKKPPGTSLDRIDNGGNYEPSNCKWSTPREQSGNQRTNVRKTYGGETMILADWARRYKMSQATLSRRIHKRGMSFEDAILTPVRPCIRTPKPPDGQKH